jgi:hypothetical protein
VTSVIDAMIYIYICVCVCVCEGRKVKEGR